MKPPHKIYCRFALIGTNLDLEENILVTIDQNGRISKIESRDSSESFDVDYSFPHHLMVPKFINAHTHIGDAILKDQVFDLSLNQAVGIGGYKYRTNRFLKSEKINAMRTALIEMINNGISTCFDFREGGINGILELREAAKDLPIDVRILGRSENISESKDIISQCDGFGLSTPNIFTKKELNEFQQYFSSQNILVATHIGETLKVIQEAIDKFGESDLQIALNYLKQKILIHLTVSNNEEFSKIPFSKFIVFCPRSNAFFGLGFPPAIYFIKKRFSIGLGTDNVMTTNPDILEELKWLILRLKEKGFSFNPNHALKLITINPSEALGLKTGCIEKGYWADLLVLNLKSCRTSFGSDPVKTLIFRSRFPEDSSLNLFRGEIVTNELK